MTKIRLIALDVDGTLVKKGGFAPTRAVRDALKQAQKRGMLVALDVRFAFVWGLLAFALNYIPNIGSVLAAIPPILQVLVFSGLYDALILLAGYLVINLVFGNILEPRIMGRGLGLSTLVVFLSLIFWGWLLGPVGMLLSVPLTIIVKIGLEQTAGGQSIAVLLSDMSHKAD